ncbi:hypothetical protein [Marinobacter sp. NFXS9]|uniref:hypothetical protein n=1 Tax=Marinobacter sp. NFXS9 TaxID=2818433 RepID=UPI0032DF1156
MSETLDLGLMPAQWFPDIELDTLTVDGDAIDITGVGEWALQGDLVLFEGRGTLRLQLEQPPRIEILDGESWIGLPADYLEHVTTVTDLRYDRSSRAVTVHARAGDKAAKVRLSGVLQSVNWMPVLAQGTPIGLRAFTSPTSQRSCR